MRTARKYPIELKKEMVKKLTVPGGPSAFQLSKAVGISQPALSRWVHEYGKTGIMSNEERTPESWTSEEKVRVVLETTKLNEKELGAYLRKRGLHSVHLEKWKEEILEGMKRLENPEGEKREQTRKIKDLERELRRKEKALAETAALLVLKKKADLIWGVQEDDELK